MKIKSIPNIDVLLEKYSHQEIYPLLTQYKATDEKGRYLAWEKFQYVHTKQTELKWLATKLNRRGLFKVLELGSYRFHYCVPDSLQAKFHFIDQESGKHADAKINQQEQAVFLIKSLMMEEAITSAQLEGAVTTRKVAKTMLETERLPKTKDERMIFNNYQLMKAVITNKKQPLSIEMILELHCLETDNAIENNAVVGAFRQSDDIYIADYDGNKLYQPPSHTQVLSLMQSVCDFANAPHNTETDFIHPVMKATILHFLIGFIHPFGDGNGRTARALFYWFMLKSGYWLFEYISISRFLKNAPKQYADAYLHTEADELDMTYFIDYQANVILRAISSLHDYLRYKKHHFSDFISKTAPFIANLPIKLNERQIQILQKAVKERGYIFTVKEIGNEFGVTENTARADLKQLLKLGLLGEMKIGRTVGYISLDDLSRKLSK